MSHPWIEKYRPIKVDELCGQLELKKLFNNVKINCTIPNLLLYGPPGTGKTSSILAICKELFGPDNYKERVVELNASNERGINVVREKINKISKSKLSNPDPNYPSPNYRFIILDEADEMTQEAQAALRKIMEDNTNTTRFCLICNYINKIIDPIISRCSKFKFKPLDDEFVKMKLKEISIKEDIVIDDECLDCISDICKGDMRKSIIMLQNSCKINFMITKSIILKQLNIPDDESVHKFVKKCIKSPVRKLANVVQQFMCYAYPSNFVLEKIVLLLVDKYQNNGELIYDILINVSKMEKILEEKGSEYLNLLNLAVYLNTTLKDK